MDLTFEQIYTNLHITKSKSKLQLNMSLAQLQPQLVLAFADVLDYSISFSKHKEIVNPDLKVIVFRYEYNNPYIWNQKMF